MRYKCTVSYIGANYDGWQTQKKNTSIQERIEEVLLRITNEEIIITGSGRTDAKVNAKGQVFHFDTDLDMSEYKWKGALNGYLPNDIYIEDVEKVFDTFHARHTVKQKEYEYRIMTKYSVFKKDCALFIPYELDINKMKEASKCFMGKHDFTSFNSSSLVEYPDQVRTIKEITFNEEENDIIITFKGKGFLRYMVRMMVGALIEVGRGKMDINTINDLLNNPSKTAFSKNAEPQGLCLNKVYYFEVLALNEEGMVREVLDDDVINEGIQYVFTTRNTQEILGYLEEDKLHVYEEKDMDIAKSLLDELKIRTNKDITIKSAD